MVAEQPQTGFEEIRIEDPDLKAALREYLNLADQMQPLRTRRKEIKAMALARALEALPSDTNTGIVRLDEFKLNVGHQEQETVSSKRKAGATLGITEQKKRGRPPGQTATEDTPATPARRTRRTRNGS